MKILSLTLILAMLCFTACDTSPRSKAENIIENSCKFHDQEDTWKDLEKFSILKKVEQYDDSGDLITTNEFEMEFRLKPFFEAKNTWDKDSIRHTVTFDGLKTKYSMGGNEVLNEGFLANKKAEIDNAFIELASPFGIINKATKISYMSKTKLMDEKEVETIEVVYGEEGKSRQDIYSCYFLPGSNQFIGYKLKNKNGYTVSNTAETTKFRGIEFPSKREVYEADSLGNHIRLIEVITYSFID